MERREFFRNIAIITGASVIGADIFLSGCKNIGSNFKLSASDISLLDEIGETIIPTTQTPGAKATEIGKFMNTIVADCYFPAEQKVFKEGLKKLNESCKKLYKKTFIECNGNERKEFLVSLEKEAAEFNKPIYEENEKLKAEHVKYSNEHPELKQPIFEPKPLHYYTMLKQLTIWGYFTSEVGVKSNFNYTPIPGKYDPKVKYKKGDKLNAYYWA